MKHFLIITMTLILGSGHLYAAHKAGYVTRHKGIVRVYKEGAVRGDRVRKAKHEIFVGDLIKTKRRAHAFVRLADESRVLLKENSIMEIEGREGLHVNEGRVLFRIKKQGAMRGLRVRSKSVIIGVKGTEFLVDSREKDLKVYLKEGRLKVESPEGEFKRFKQEKKEEFEDYKRKKVEEFEDYKKELEEEFIEYVNEFEMDGGTAIHIRGNEVRDIALSPDIEEEFRLFDMDEIN